MDSELASTNTSNNNIHNNTTSTAAATTTTTTSTSEDYIDFNNINEHVIDMDGMLVMMIK